MTVKITNDQKNLIESSTIAFATCNVSGKPNVIAVACVKVVGEDKILITDNFFNKTQKNLTNNNHVALAVWTKDEEEGIQLKGKAEYLTQGPWKEMVDQLPENQKLAHKAAVLITVEEIWDLATPRLISRK